MVNLSPSTMTRRPYKFRLEVAASSMVNDENDGKSDHVEAMAADPVGCLFAQTNLAARIGWMLSPGPALRLPPDTVAHALPALLITAARHSAALDLLVLPNRLYWVVFFYGKRYSILAPSGHNFVTTVLQLSVLRSLLRPIFF